MNHSRTHFKSLTVVLFLGVASGLPLALTSGSLQAWLTVAGVPLHTIGFLSLVGLPYTLKFLWAPLMDRFVPPFLGRRRGWIVLMQGALAGILIIMGSFHPEQSTEQVMFLASCAVILAFLSASQDIVIDAYRTELLNTMPEKRGLGASLSTLGYRIAMLISGAGALMLGHYVGWQWTYWIMAGLIGLHALITFFADEVQDGQTAPKTLLDAVIVPFQDFFQRERALFLLILIVLYKLGDAFAGSLSTAFLIRGVGFSLVEVGTINKGMGMLATIFGSLFGGMIMLKLRLFPALLLFGILQALSNLGFWALALSGKVYALMIFAIGFENFSGGLGSTAFVALIMGLCHKKATATQFALLSALAAVGRVWVGPTAGYLVEAWGWAPFFIFSFLIALPGLCFLYFLKTHIMRLDMPETASTT